MNFEQELQNAKQVALPALPDPSDFKRLMQSSIPSPHVVVEGLLDTSSRMIFGGGSKTYKSWAMIDLSLSIACGVPWWGFSTNQSAILYVNFELKEWYARERIKAIVESKKLSVDPSFWFIWNLRGYEPKLGEFKVALLEAIQRLALQVVFIDPFYTLLNGGADERISAEIMPVLAMFGEINRQSGATVVCAAHFTKGNQAAKDPMDRISGGAVLNRYPDCLLTLTKHDTDQAFTIDLIARDCPPLDPFVVRWQYPLLVKDPSLDPARVKTQNKSGRPNLYSHDDILQILADHDDQLATSELCKLVQEETLMSNGTFYDLWKEIKTQKLVFKSKLSHKWNLTTKQRLHLAAS